MVEFKEHNNRNIAKKYAEFVTGTVLRQYVAEKVKKYVGNGPIVFDGAVGSGQLEQYVEPSFLYGCDIQKESCESCIENFPNSEIKTQSFFQYDEDVICDCVIMNPPFSLMFKDLPDEDKVNIQNEFEWKRSGKVDDIFLLKSLKYTQRYGFYIMFPGIGYRSQELKMREIIGNNLVEMNIIENGFEDTSISVLFLVIDKQKADKTVFREIYDCKIKSIKFSDTWDVDVQKWEQPRTEKEKENIDIDAVNNELNDIVYNNVKNHLEMHFLIETVFNNDTNYLGFITKMMDLLVEYETLFNLTKGRVIV